MQITIPAGTLTPGFRAIVDPLGELTHWQRPQHREALESWPYSTRPGPTDLADLTARNQYMQGVRAAILAHPDESLVWFSVHTERCHHCARRLRGSGEFDVGLCHECRPTQAPEHLDMLARLTAEYREQ